MLFFTKPEFKEMILPFTYEDNPEELYAGILSIEVYTNILGEYKYCSASYIAKVECVDEMAELLRDNYNKTIKVVFKIKKGKVKGFKIDLDSLAEAYCDERFKTLELIGWGVTDKSYREFVKKY